jgi:hypothetical protein
MLPLNWLSSRVRVWSDVIAANSVGIVPLSRLSPRERSSRDVSAARRNGASETKIASV